VDNISNITKKIKGMSLYYVTSWILAVALLVTNWIGGLIFIAGWLIVFYLWSQLSDELRSFPDLEQSSIIPLILRRFNTGNLLLVIWAAALIVLQILAPTRGWLIYPVALAAFIPPFWALKTLKKIKETIEATPLGISNLFALETLSQIDTLILDEVCTGEIQVEEILLADGIKEELFGKIMGTFLHALHAKDAALMSLSTHFRPAKTYPVKNIISLTKERNWTSMYLESIGTVYLGPAEMMLKEIPDFVNVALADGKRMMVLAVGEGEHEGKELPETLFTISMVVMADVLQPGALELASVLKEQDIQLKVLTKDDASRTANLCHFHGLEITPSEEAIFGNLTNSQKNEICHWLAESSEVAYIGNLGINLNCHISSDVSSQPDLLLPGSNLSELANVLENSLGEIRKLAGN